MPDTFNPNMWCPGIPRVPLSYKQTLWAWLIMLSCIMIWFSGWFVVLGRIVKTLSALFYCKFSEKTTTDIWFGDGDYTYDFYGINTKSTPAPLKAETKVQRAEIKVEEVPYHGEL